jgi:hypothetical protein
VHLAVAVDVDVPVPVAVLLILKFAVPVLSISQLCAVVKWV